MIKLKNILREAGLIGEQANQPQVLNVTPGTTQQQLQQQLIDSGLDLTNPVTINLTFAQDRIAPLPDNGVPAPNQITQLQTTLAAINAIGQNVSAVVNAGTTNVKATGTGAPTALLTPAGSNFIAAFPNVAAVYSNRTDNTPSNDFLLLNRAGSVYQAAINTGIRNITTTIPTDGTATRQSNRFATLSVTGIFEFGPPGGEQLKFTFDVAVRIPNDVEIRSGKLSTIPLYIKQYEKTTTPGKWVNEKSQPNFKSFVSKLAKRTNPGLTPEQFKTIDPAVFDKFATLNNLISNIDIIDYLRTNRDILLQKPFLQKWNQDKAAIGIDNVIKLFSE